MAIPSLHRSENVHGGILPYLCNLCEAEEKSSKRWSFIYKLTYLKAILLLINKTIQWRPAASGLSFLAANTEAASLLGHIITVIKKLT